MLQKCPTGPNPPDLDFPSCARQNWIEWHAICTPFKNKIRGNKYLYGSIFLFYVHLLIRFHNYLWQFGVKIFYFSSFLPPAFVLLGVRHFSIFNLSTFLAFGKNIFRKPIPTSRHYKWFELIILTGREPTYHLLFERFNLKSRLIEHQSRILLTP